MKAFQRIVIKIGTNVLTRPDGLLDLTNISHLVDQIARLKGEGTDVILVSSGAVGAGRTLMPQGAGASKVVRRQVLSAIGQVRLMEIYRQLFDNHRIFCAQVLATKEDFRDRSHYLNMKNCFHALLRDNVIPIVNENDVISVSELMFTDNDELASLVGAMINAEAMIILSSVDGLMDGPPDDPNSRVVPKINPEEKKWLDFIQPSRSSFGRGGMLTKFRIAQKAAKVGVHTFIANGKRQNIVIDILNGNFIGTHFVSKENNSNVKKWIAYTEEAGKCAVYVNPGAEAALCASDKVSSLLPVGVVRLEGNFKKGDLIQIYNEREEAIGIGVAQYGAATARQYLGQKGKKPLIHYDYLFVGWV